MADGFGVTIAVSYSGFQLAVQSQGHTGSHIPSSDFGQRLPKCTFATVVPPLPFGIPLVLVQGGNENFFLCPNFFVVLSVAVVCALDFLVGRHCWVE